MGLCIFFSATLKPSTKFAPNKMDHQENSTAPPLQTQSSAISQADRSGGNAYLYILIIMCFYGVFLCGIMLGYFRSKRREKRRINIFTRLVHEEEQREWGALPKKHSLTFSVPAASGLRSVHVSLPFCGNQGNHFGHLHCEDALPSPLACALLTEQSSVSSLCSSADTRLAIEEEADSGTAEEPEEKTKGGSDKRGDDSGWTPWETKRGPSKQEETHQLERRSGGCDASVPKTTQTEIIYSAIKTLISNIMIWSQAWIESHKCGQWEVFYILNPGHMVTVEPFLTSTVLNWNRDKKQ